MPMHVRGRCAHRRPSAAPAASGASARTRRGTWRKLGIAAEQLVAAEAGQRDLQAGLARRLGDEVGVHAVDRRLVHRGEQALALGGEIARRAPSASGAARRADARRSRQAGSRRSAPPSNSRSPGSRCAGGSAAQSRRRARRSSVESRPAERNTPTGTSAMRWWRDASRAAHRAAAPRRAAGSPAPGSASASIAARSKNAPAAPRPLPIDPHRGAGRQARGRRDRA